MGILKVELDEILLEIAKKKTITIFGAGSFGQYIAKKLSNNQLEVDFYIDNDPRNEGKFIQNKPVILANQLSEMDLSNVVIFVCSTWSKEITVQLEKMNISNFFVIDFEKAQCLEYILKDVQQQFDDFYNQNHKSLKKVLDLLEDELSKKTFINILKYRQTGNPDYISKSAYDQYFHPLNSPCKGDVIIDGGAFIGDTAKIFSDYLQQECIIHSFEPSSENYKELKQLSIVYKNIIAINSGIGNKTEMIYVKPDNGLLNTGYHLGTIGEQELKLFSIDDYVASNKIEKVDLIKLDIEGFELDALKGAIQTIRTYRPKLQVCLYHKFEDLIEIPQFFVENFKDLGYQIYIGHHTNSYLETVMYASCKQ